LKGGVLKSLLMLWQKVADESADRCCTSATMDFKRVLGRFEHEGLSFLTITLPAFGKDFEKSLDLGRVDRHLFSGFQRKGGLPRFLGGFLDLVFDRITGELLTEPSIDAILAVRQLTLMFGKIALPCSDTRRRRAMRQFVECELEVRENDSNLTPIDLERFKRMSALLFRNAFTWIDREIYYGRVYPKHGPGATADKLTGNSKFRNREWTTRLEEIFPYGEYSLPNWSYYDQLDEVDFREPGRERPVRVVDVPKTLKTPRIIAIEPTCMQYMQQGVLDLIRNAFSRDDILDRMIGFDDQIPNQEMARIGSLLGTEATLDLSEASDRVSNQLVRVMVSNHKHLHHALDATRSRKADVPGHGVIRLAKFASMGSAVCFPIEAMVFTTLIFLGIEDSLNYQLSRRDVKRLSDKVRVYGDDIIVPVDHVRSVVRVLEHFGARVNSGKSFWTGKFRESCGREFYDGHDVSIVRVRREFPTHRRHAMGVVSLVSLRNQLYFAGYWGTCRWLDGEIEKLIRHFPVVLPSSPVQGRHSFLGYSSQKMCDRLHRPLVKGYVVKSRIPSDPLDDSGALLKCLSNRSELPTADERHLERAGRPKSVDIKLGWASPV